MERAIIYDTRMSRRRFEFGGAIECRYSPQILRFSLPVTSRSRGCCAPHRACISFLSGQARCSHFLHHKNHSSYSVILTLSMKNFIATPQPSTPSPPKRREPYASPSAPLDAQPLTSSPTLRHAPAAEITNSPPPVHVSLGRRDSNASRGPASWSGW
jgi:hypothetical protein